MRTALLTAATTTAALLFAPIAVADHKPGHSKPPTSNPDLTIAANPNPVLWAKATTISGRLRGSDNSGKTVELQDNPWPFPGPFAPVATATTTSNGEYSFRVKPRLHTNYRTVAQVTPPVTSDEVRVRVRMRINRRVSDRTPRRGQKVTFRGAVSPAHDGQRVYIQRRAADGSWRTVAIPKLYDAGEDRPNKSLYKRTLRIYRDGVFRVRVRKDADHLGNKTRRVRLDVP